jgi:predicted hydrocarbon binding protein
MDREWLQDFIQSAVLVSDVEVREGVEGFLADSLNFPLTWNTGERALVFRMETAQSMLDEIRATAGAEVVYRAGYKHGLNAWKKIFTEFRPGTQEGLAEVLHILGAVGWGVFELHSVDFKHKMAVIRMSEGFECQGITSNESYSQFIRGHITGCLTAYFGVDMNVVESKCTSKGDKQCEFTAQPKA